MVELFLWMSMILNPQVHCYCLAYDYNEVDYDIFIEALHAVFVESQYEDHYKKMMGEWLSVRYE